MYTYNHEDLFPLTWQSRVILRVDMGRRGVVTVYILYSEEEKELNERDWYKADPDPFIRKIVCKNLTKLEGLVFFIKKYLKFEFQVY